MTQRMKSMVLLSGGIDSTVLLAQQLKMGHECHAFIADYGQRHRIEVERAGLIATMLSVPQTIVQLPHVFGDANSQTGSVPVPRGHYTDKSMKVTVVPNRNMVLLSLATANAVAHGCRRVCYAAHAGDHAIYPDCTPQFYEAMRSAIGIATDYMVHFDAPFVRQDKSEIVAMGARIGAPLHLTWSCYDPTPNAEHCGCCGTCVERREAFRVAEVLDPTRYA